MKTQNLIKLKEIQKKIQMKKINYYNLSIKYKINKLIKNLIIYTNYPTKKIIKKLKYILYIL